MYKIIRFLGIMGGILFFSACYNNKKDISQPTADAIKKISFRDDIVPIITSGACGCHNNNTTRAVQFMSKDTILYGVILARAGVFADMANGKAHPGEGSIWFSPSQAAIIKAWIAQGGTDNYVPPPVTGPVGYAANIVPLYKTVCKGGSCHGGIGPTLDYAYMANVKADLAKMMSTAGKSGHKGGPLSIDGTTAATFSAWIAQGLPQ